jgi:hypothetical protein
MSAAPPAHPLVSAPLAGEPGGRSGRPGILRAELLFQGSQEILIEQKGETYRLRITRNGKLILTK